MPAGHLVHLDRPAVEVMNCRQRQGADQGICEWPDESRKDRKVGRWAGMATRAGMTGRNDRQE